MSSQIRLSGPNLGLKRCRGREFRGARCGGNVKEDGTVAFLSQRQFINVELSPLNAAVSWARAHQIRAAGLYTSDAFIHQHFDFDATVLRSSLLRLVGCCRSIFSHRTRRDDMPYWHTALLHQESYHRFCASLA
jgi:hypothetical protein